MLDLDKENSPLKKILKQGKNGRAKDGDQSLLIKQDPDIQLIYTLEEGESGECETQM